jgi:hypothetical protein
MYITPPIDGYVYQITDSTSSSVLEALDELRQMANSTQLLSPTQYSNSWVNAYNEGTNIDTSFDTLTTSVGTLTGSANNSVQDIIDYLTTATTAGSPAVTTDAFISQYNALTTASSLAVRQSYIDILYEARANLPALIEHAMNDVIGGVSGTSTVMARPAVQDYVLYTYSVAGEGTLFTQMTELENQIGSNKDIASYLNQINIVLTLNLDVDMNVETTDGSSINAYKTQVMSARNQLSAIASGLLEVTSGQSDLQANIQYFIQLSNSDGATDLGSWLYGNGGNTAAADWWNDINNTSNINSLYSNIAFFNQTLQNEIQEATLIYINFFQSASTFISTIDQAATSIGKRIGKRS